jgi:hypothetical protein
MLQKGGSIKNFRRYTMLEFHPVFETPEANQLIWRYLDLGRYLALLSSSALHFTRGDKFEDRWEGEYPEPNKAAMKQLATEMALPLDWFREYQEVGRKMKHSIFVNCWHESEYESAAMWRLYGQEGFNLAIVSTMHDARSAFDVEKEHKVYCGRVKYIDYSRDYLPGNNAFSPWLRKRKSFAFESEVRFIVWDWPKTKVGEEVKHQLPPPADFRVNGHDVKVDTAKLVKQVLVSPKAADWYVKVIQEITTKYGLKSEIVSRSKFEDGPIQ